MYTQRELLKGIRETARLTQQELADLLGVHKMLIAMMETGKREMSKDFIASLAKALGVSSLSIAPILYANEPRPSGLAGRLVDIAEALQKTLVSRVAKKLIKDARD